ncbi:hypothetical protein [Pontibacillus sp. HMF3514]|uniref:hypothetical protein n=1 Tax=Pontibacillus sp. HMF3514 TaxID=2692425 RepID=UPI00132056D7|nr:hypothetical protein [Pontibacillus sp. HMF3514]QHE51598.1 hypothetical protein GS400_05910 [Pontibacillus sp. HMF3514]
MKKIIFGIVVVITLAYVFVYIEHSKKNHSYSTPEVALSNVKNPKLDVLKIIDTKFYENVAYVFFHSAVGETRNNYLGVGRINKNEYGWRFKEIIGVGNIDNNNSGMASGKDDYIVGFAKKEVDKVRFGNHDAQMITIDNKYMNAFLFHGVDSDLLGQTDFVYLDTEGNELPY